MMLSMDNWLLIFSTILGPVLAVQAQKWVERVRKRNDRKEWIFNTLMSTRGNRTDVNHVTALNLIELAFYGSNFFWKRRTKTEEAVLDAWKEYLDKLNTTLTPETLQIWSAQREELFIELLLAVSNDLGYKFDRVVLKKGAYLPVAHGDYFAELASLRKFGIEVLEGKRAIKMDITSIPTPPQPPTASKPEITIANNKSEQVPEKS